MPRSQAVVPVVVDACVTLNLLATQHEVEVVEALGLHLLLPERAAREVQYLWTPEDKDGVRYKVPASLERLLQSGRLELRTAEDDDVWMEAWFDFSAHIDDADAACLSLAGVLGLPLLTDDRKASRLAREATPPIALRSTLELLHAASLALGWTPIQLERVAFDLYHRGNFNAPRADRLRDWFLALLR